MSTAGESEVIPEVAHAWRPIVNLEDEPGLLERPDLRAAAQQWRQERTLLKDQTKIDEFGRQLARKWAIETGIIERLYDVDRGITENFITVGFQAGDSIHTSLVPRDVKEIIIDHEDGLDFVFDFVKQERPLSTSYIKELHQLLLRHQDRTEAVDQFGTKFATTLIKGDWKKTPNNPTQPDGKLHEYCPPEQVSSEMDSLIRMYEEIDSKGNTPEVIASWLHHRFSQIHPFQDGNGRVARALATMIFIRANLLPLVVTRDHRDRYLDTLREADGSDLKPLVDLFADIEIGDLQNEIEFVRTLRGAGVAKIISSAAERAALRERESLEGIQDLTSRLLEIASIRFEEVKAETALAFGQGGLQVTATVDANREDNVDWWGKQIIDTARKSGYFANLQRSRRWVQLRLNPGLKDAPTTHIVTSFHHKERVAGLMVATTFVTYTSGEVEGLEVIKASDDPFTYSLDHKDVEQTFRAWLEESLESALDHWQRNL